jgi:hypothetical protein
MRTEYRPDATNVVADALSHGDTEAEAEVMALFALSFALFDELWQEVRADDALAALKAEVEVVSCGDKCAIVNDLVTVGGRVYVLLQN